MRTRLLLAMLAVLAVSSVALIATLVIVDQLGKENQQILSIDGPALVAGQTLDISLTRLDDDGAGVLFSYLEYRKNADASYLAQTRSEITAAKARLSDAGAKAADAVQRSAYAVALRKLTGPGGYLIDMEQELDFLAAGKNDAALATYNNTHYLPVSQALQRYENDAQANVNASGVRIAMLQRLRSQSERFSAYSRLSLQSSWRYSSLARSPSASPRRRMRFKPSSMRISATFARLLTRSRKAT